MKENSTEQSEIAEPYELPERWKWIRFAKCVKWGENERTHKK